MSRPKPKIIIVLGPTASGKTKLAVKLARDFNGEIISADSRQVYKYMDIGTGKDLDEYNIPSKSGLKRIKHHLIDVVSPKSTFNVSAWQKATNKAILEIQKKGKLPIICGGTALYIYALEKGYQLPEPAKKGLGQIRKRLDKLSLNQLLTRLKKIDQKTFKIIDQKNKRRVQRALEIYYQFGKTKSELEKNVKPKYDFLKIGIKLDKEKLHQKIDKRLNTRFKQGMIREIKKLRKLGVSWKRLDDFGLEYRWLSLHLRNKIDFDELKTGLARDIKRFAKRQMTWFDKDKEINWVNNYTQTKNLVKKFLLTK